MPRQVIVGLCRFSYLGRSDTVAWRTRPGTPEEVRTAIAADLYARPRLERRLFSFRRLCLASIRAQTDKDFTFLVVTSPELPAWARRRLEAICAGCDNVELVVSDAPTLGAAIAGPLEKIGSGGAPVVQFRLDDDDALHVNYIAALRRHAERMQDLSAFAVSFANNLAVSVYPGQPTGRWMIQRPFVAAGLAARPPAGRSLFSYGHFAMRQRITNITDLDQVGALVLKWPSDSRPEVVGQESFGYRPLDGEGFDRHLRRGFPFLKGFDFDALRPRADGAADGEAASVTPPAHRQDQA